MASKYSSSPMSHTDGNYEVLDKLLSKTDDESVKQYIETVGDWANENGLVLTEDLASFSAKRSGGSIYTTTASLSIIDPQTGIHINVFQEAFEGNLFEMFDDNYSPLNKDNLNEFLRQYRTIDPDYLKRAGITNINIDSLYPQGIPIRPGTGGYFTSDRPNSIQLPLLQLNHPNSNGVGIRGTIIHETAHAYDFNRIGKGTHVGSKSIFTTYKGNGKVFPTEYAGKHYKESKDLPEWYRKSEVISTVTEQVESHTLRNDALLSNGNKPKNYEEWANDPVWKPMVKEAEKIING